MDRDAGRRCLLCASTSTVLVERLDVDLINDLWEDEFGITGALAVDHLTYHSCSSCGLGFFDPPAAGGPDLYRQLQAFDWYYMHHKPEYAMAVHHLGGVDSVLEVGAGQGVFSRYLPDRHYVGLDTNVSAIEVAAETGIAVRNESVSEHATAGHRYGAVVAFQVLEHVADPDGFLRDCFRCLEPGGRLVVAVPAADGFVGQAVNSLLDMPPHHVTHWRDRTFDVAAVRLGCDLVALEHEAVADYHEDWARSVLIQERLRSALGIGHRLLDRRLVSRVVERLARVLAIRTGRPSLAGRSGHTVIAVFG